MIVRNDGHVFHCIKLKEKKCKSRCNSLEGLKDKEQRLEKWLEIPSDFPHGDSSLDNVTECVSMREVNLTFCTYQRTMRCASYLNRRENSLFLFKEILKLKLIKQKAFVRCKKKPSEIILTKLNIQCGQLILNFIHLTENEKMKYYILNK